MLSHRKKDREKEGSKKELDVPPFCLASLSLASFTFSGPFCKVPRAFLIFLRIYAQYITCHIRRADPRTTFLYVSLCTRTAVHEYSVCIVSSFSSPLLRMCRHYFVFPTLSALSLISLFIFQFFNNNFLSFYFLSHLTLHFFSFTYGS